MLRKSSVTAPLSLSQEQLWHFTQLVPGNPVYNEMFSIRKDGSLDIKALRASLNELIRRHQIWRSTFELINGEPVQVVQVAPTVDMPLIDLSGLPDRDREPEAVRLAGDEARRPYDLGRGALIRPLLFRFSPAHHRLYVAMHHLIFDSVSLYRIVFPELTAVYDAFAAGKPSPLPEPPTQYADYVAWERESAVSPSARRRLDYWRQRLCDAPSLQLPFDHSRPTIQRFRGRAESICLPRDLADGLRSLSQQTGITFFETVAAAFTVLLHRYSGQSDVVFGTTTDMRTEPDHEGLVGYCVTPTVLRNDVSGDPTFVELVRRVHEDVRVALDNRIPFEVLVRELHPKRDTGANPIFQVMLVVESHRDSVDPEWSIRLMEAGVGNQIGNAKFDLHLELDERPEGHVDGRLIYDSDVFDHGTVSRMAANWAVLLEGIVAAPNRRISELPILTEAERRLQLVDWNATIAHYPRDACIHHLITAQAQRTPDAVALVFGNDELTYGDLERRANRLAHRLQAANPRRGIVGICVERSLDLVVGMLAILKSGAGYLPLDPQYPGDRLAFMLEDSDAAVLLTHTSLRSVLSVRRAEVVCLDDASLGGDCDAAPESGATAGDLAYLLYTSGSTGKPKGVYVPHRAVVNLLTSMSRQPGIRASDTMLAVTTHAFDIAVIELWLPLVTGAKVVIASREVVSDGQRLAGLITDASPTIMQATPSGWQLLIDAGWGGDDGLVALCGGEALPRQLADSLIGRTAALWNMYGPTETTVWSTIDRVDRSGPLTIGRPIDNTTVYVLDQWRQPVPIGVHGELWIGGEGMSGGYHNRPAETAERFVPDPFAPGSLMYRTGDLVRLCDDGRIQYIGRLDHQVKIRGFRIELGEIEATLTADTRIASALVVAREDTPGDRRLVAYLVCAAGEMLPTAELQTVLRRSLPDYMVPSAFVALDRFPLTPNGKVDRNALPPPERDRTRATASRSPRSATEECLSRIWARILNLKQVGIDDDFFELGGHSMLAVRLLTAVELKFGVPVPMTAFFDGSANVAGMAAFIERHKAAAVDGQRQPIAPRSGGSRPPLFFVQPGEFAMLTIRHFARTLGPDQPVIGLLPERQGARFDSSRSVEDLAATMLRTMRDAQPVGPYYIAGFSFGGLLAYELAGQLRASGEDVAWLALLDAGPPAYTRAAMRRRLSLHQRMARQRARGLRGSIRHLCTVGARELRAGLVRVHLRESRLTDDFDWRGADRLSSRYACSGHDAPLCIFATTQGISTSGSDSLGWEEVHRGSLMVHEVPGEHVTMVIEPDVFVVAEMLSESLRRAQSADVVLA